jgi:hypothetical protein
VSLRAKNRRRRCRGPKPCQVGCDRFEIKVHASRLCRDQACGPRHSSICNRELYPDQADRADPADRDQSFCFPQTNPR